MSSLIAATKPRSCSAPRRRCVWNGGRRPACRSSDRPRQVNSVDVTLAAPARFCGPRHARTSPGDAPDQERMKQAKDFAYSKRKMIHAAFDAGRFKTDVLDELGSLFEKSGGTPCQ